MIQSRAEVLMSLLGRLPRTRAVVVRAWGASYLRSGRRSHWVFDRLRAAAGIRFRQPLRLATGQLIYADPFDLIGSHIRHHGLYEAETVSVFQALLSPGMTVVDAGANIGQYTLIAAAAVGAAGSVHAFEPNPTCLVDLRASVAANGMPQVRAHELGLWRETTDATLYRGDVENLGASSIQPGLHTTGDTTQIRLTTLDAYAAHAGLDRLDLIKADVEGAELGMLEGAVTTLDRFKPALLMEFSDQSEAFGSSKVAQAAFLLERGYRLWAIVEGGLRPYVATSDRNAIMNVLCLPQGRSLPEALAARVVGQ